MRRSRRLFYVSALVASLGIGLISSVQAAKPGDATLSVRDATTGLTDLTGSVGDTLTVELFMASGSAPITGVSVFMTMDDSLFELIPLENN